MVQVNGMRLPVQRFRRERTGRVKYSTSCPWRTLSPCEASLAMPTRRCACKSGSKGREDIHSPFVRHYSTIEPNLSENQILNRGRAALQRRVNLKPQARGPERPFFHAWL